MSEQKSEIEIKYRLSFKIGVVFVIILWIANLLVLFVDNSGAIGDTFGVVNSLYSGFAFLGIIYTILLQREDLQIQRHELRLTTDELRRSADAHHESQASLAQQAEHSKTSSELAALNALLNYHLARYKMANKNHLYQEEFVEIREMKEVAERIKNILDSKYKEC